MRPWYTTCLKFIICMVFCVFFDAFFHIILQDNVGSSMSMGLITKLIGKRVTGLIFLLISFLIIGITFIYVFNTNPNPPTYKGLIYGVSIGGIWFLLISEFVVIFDLQLFDKAIIGFVDASAITLYCLFLGKSVLPEIRHSQGFSNNGNRDYKQIKTELFYTFEITLLIVGGSYFLAKNFAIGILNIYSPISTGTPNLLTQFIWTTCMGIWISLIATILFFSSNNSKFLFSSNTSLSSINLLLQTNPIVQFFIIYGSNFSLLALYIPLFYEAPLFEILLITVLDVTFMTSVVWITQKILCQFTQTVQPES